jgi:hypothetical protein
VRVGPDDAADAGKAPGSENTSVTVVGSENTSGNDETHRKMKMHTSGDESTTLRADGHAACPRRSLRAAGLRAAACRAGLLAERDRSARRGEGAAPRTFDGLVGGRPLSDGGRGGRRRVRRMGRVRHQPKIHRTPLTRPARPPSLVRDDGGQLPGVVQAPGKRGPRGSCGDGDGVGGRARGLGPYSGLRPINLQGVQRGSTAASVCGGSAELHIGLRLQRFHRHQQRAPSPASLRAPPALTSHGLGRLSRVRRSDGAGAALPRIPRGTCERT